MTIDINEITKKVEEKCERISVLRSEIGKVIVGQQTLVDRLLQALLCNNHVLIEGVPGLAKTLSVTTLARTLDASFQRIQFTPDLLPADLLGTLIYNPKSGDFSTKKGPVFAHIILADEINRAPAKVQSALLEAMQERQVTIGEETFPLPYPFLVLATQNPIDQEGTYQLPEAQIDRFIFKLVVDYPSEKEELEILHRHAASTATASVQSVLTPAEVLELQEVADCIHMDEQIAQYIVSLVRATRDTDSHSSSLKGLVRYGASPRASLFLAMASRANAFLNARGYVTPQDVKEVAMDTLRHRVILTYEAEAEEKSAEDIVQKILDSVKVP